MHPKALEGLLRARGPMKMHSVPQEGVRRTRISAPYQRRGFPVPNITPVPEKPVFYTECLRKRAAYPRSLFCAPRVYSVPQEALSGTECHKHNAVTSCGADYCVINTLITAIPSLRTSASWKPPGTRNNRFAEKPLQLFQKIAGTFTQFFYICAE